MPLYMTKFSYTPETWARLIGNPEDRRKAAQLLGVSYKTLLNKIKECGISRST